MEMKINVNVKQKMYRVKGQQIKSKQMER